MKTMKLKNRRPGLAVLLAASLAVGSLGANAQGYFTSTGFLGGTTSFISCSGIDQKHVEFRSSQTLTSSQTNWFNIPGGSTQWQQKTTVIDQMAVKLYKVNAGGDIFIGQQIIYCNVPNPGSQANTTKAVMIYEFEPGANITWGDASSGAATNGLSGSFGSPMQEGTYYIKTHYTHQVSNIYRTEDSDIDPAPPDDSNGSSEGADIMSNQVTMTIGKAPVFTMNGQSDPANVFQDCNLTGYKAGFGARVFLNPSVNCGISDFVLSVWEVDGFTYNSWGGNNTIGPEYYRALTSPEISQMTGSGGFNISSFTGQGSQGTINLVTGHYYRIKLVYTAYGVWKESSIRMHYKKGSYDLMLKDFAADKGYEPSAIIWTTEDIDHSPDLWNNIVTPGSTPSPVHANPDHITVAANSNRLFATVRNVGCTASDKDVPLRLYWTLNRTNEYWKHDWILDLVSNGAIGAVSGLPFPLGSEITVSNVSFADPYGLSGGTSNISQPILLPIIPAGGAYTASADWFPPDPADVTTSQGVHINNGHPVLCLLGRIDNPSPNNSKLDPIIWEQSGPNDIRDYHLNNNNVALRNTYLYDDKNFIISHGNGGWDHGVGTVITDPGFLNPQITFPAKRKLCVDLIPNPLVLQTFNNFGSIDLVVTDGIWNAWSSGGFTGSNVAYAPNNPGVITITNGNGGCIQNVSFTQEMLLEMAGLRFNFSGTLPSAPISFQYRLRMMSDDNFDTFHSCNTVFDVDVPVTSPFTEVATRQATGIAEVGHDKINYLMAYPNPSNDLLMLSCQPSAPGVTGQISILDASGRQVQVIACGKKEGLFTESVDTRSWANGIYFIQYQSGDRLFTQKVSVVH